MHVCRYFDSHEDTIEHNPLQVHHLREQILANAKFVYRDDNLDLLTGVDLDQQDIRYAHLIRRTSYSNRAPMAIFLVIRGLPDKCPLLGMLHFLEERVCANMETEFGYNAVDWNSWK